MADEDRPAQQAEDLTVFVQNLLNQMQTRFQQMSESILGRIDEMGTRIDELEQSIGELMEDAADEPRGPVENAGKRGK